MHHPSTLPQCSSVLLKTIISNFVYKLWVFYTGGEDLVARRVHVTAVSYITCHHSIISGSEPSSQHQIHPQQYGIGPTDHLHSQYGLYQCFKAKLWLNTCKKCPIWCFAFYSTVASSLLQSLNPLLYMKHPPITIKDLPGTLACRMYCYHNQMSVMAPVSFGAELLMPKIPAVVNWS